MDFAIVHTATIDHQTVEVARADCDHGEVHIHAFAPGGTDWRSLVIRIDGQADVDRGWDDAYEIVASQYEENLRRWTR